MKITDATHKATGLQLSVAWLDAGDIIELGMRGAVLVVRIGDDGTTCVDKPGIVIALDPGSAARRDLLLARIADSDVIAAALAGFGGERH